MLQINYHKGSIFYRLHQVVAKVQQTLIWAPTVVQVLASHQAWIKQQDRHILPAENETGLSCQV